MRANCLKDYAHYSSVRNLNGPFTGPPNLQTLNQTAEGVAQMKRELAEVEGWRVDTVMKALPFPLNQATNRANVRKTLEHCNGNMDDAVSILLPDSSPGSTSPSSIERDADSDDEKAQNPNKKRDRRVSRPHPLRYNLAVPVVGKDSVILSPDPVRLATALKKVSEDKGQHFDPDETEEENWKDEMMYQNSTSSGSSSSRHSTPPPKVGNTNLPKIRLKISGPKAQQNSQPQEAGSVSSSYSSQSNFADAEADAEDAPQVLKKEPQLRVIAKPRRRLISGYERARLMQEKAAHDSHNDSTAPVLSRVNLMARNNSMKRLDSSIEAIHI